MPIRESADHLGTIDADAYTPASASGAPTRKIDTRGGPTGLADQLVRFAVGHRAIGLDRIAVWTCEDPLTPGSAPRASTVAEWAGAIASPYFVDASGGRYRQAFVPLGTIERSSDLPFDSPGCADLAAERTPAGYTNVLVVQEQSTGSSYAREPQPLPDPTFPACFAACFLVPRPPLADPASVTGRSVTLMLEHFESNDAYSLIHELGHTLHWPHSHVAHGTDADEYDNPVDVMSSRLPPWCVVDCLAQWSMGFNRFASGWIDERNVAVHRDGTSRHWLNPPTSDAKELVIVPASSGTGQLLTIEARPNTGQDAPLEHGGVAVHFVHQGYDQPRDDRGFLVGFGNYRAQGPAWGSSDSYDHVLQAGESQSIDGITVTVIERRGSRYRVQVSGAYAPPRHPPE